jgi:RNA polymerase sigma-70 factor, ECF subfamily
VREARDQIASRASMVLVASQAEVIGNIGQNIGVCGANERSSETELIRAAQRGDSDAFEQLVRAHDHAVLRMAYNLLRSEEDARDVYQEVFLRVYRNLPKFRFDCSFKTWLYRIVSNLCLDQLRKRKVRKEESASFDTDAGEVDRFQFIPEQRADVDPQRQMMSTEVQERVQEVLGKLTPRERLVFEMRHFQGMRLRAIGESLSVTEEAAKNCLFRATQKMRSALGDFV